MATFRRGPCKQHSCRAAQRVTLRMFPVLLEPVSIPVVLQQHLWRESHTASSSLQKSSCLPFQFRVSKPDSITCHLSPLPETSGLVAGIHLPSKCGAVKFWFLTIGGRASNPRPIQQSGNLFGPYCRGGLGNINGIWREFPVSEIRLSVGFWRSKSCLDSFSRPTQCPVFWAAGHTINFA
jgi:hypothetical protein